MAYKKGETFFLLKHLRTEEPCYLMYTVERIWKEDRFDHIPYFCRPLNESNSCYGSLFSGKEGDWVGEDSMQKIYSLKIEESYP